jgi:4-carboxymuconolactone decarboxylase
MTNDSVSKRYLRGLEKLRMLGGSEEAIFAANAGIAPDLSRYVVEFAFGDLWSRPGLDACQRQMLTIAALTSIGDTHRQLMFHIRGALQVGVEPSEIVEVILHCLAFAGFPRVVNAVATARTVFEEHGLLPLPDTTKPED